MPTRSARSRHAWLRDVKRPLSGSVYIGHDLIGTATSMIPSPSVTDTPIFDDMVANRSWWWHTMTWHGKRLACIEFVPPEDRNPPWSKRVNQP